MQGQGIEGESRRLSERRWFSCLENLEELEDYVYFWKFVLDYGFWTRTQLRFESIDFCLAGWSPGKILKKILAVWNLSIYMFPNLVLCLPSDVNGVIVAKWKLPPLLHSRSRGHFGASKEARTTSMMERHYILNKARDRYDTQLYIPMEINWILLGVCS